MTRLIDADALKKEFVKHTDNYGTLQVGWDYLIDNSPSIIEYVITSDGLPVTDLRPRPTGKWLLMTPYIEEYHKCHHPVPFMCSACKKIVYFIRDTEKEATICPFCRVQMEVNKE